MKAVNVAIVGATGAVGEELLKILAERKFPIKSLKLLASPRSAGKVIKYNEVEYRVEAVDFDKFDQMDIAFFAAGGSVTEKYAKAAVEAGCVVIDNSSAYRMDPDVPLVVPEVNKEAALTHQGIIANPNCSTTIMAVALKPIYDRVGIKRVVVSTYQAVSGAGYLGMEELESQVISHANNESCEPKVLPVSSLKQHYPILFNAIPQIDIPGDGDYTKEEWKMIKETQKIFADPEMNITVTAVRVPVLRSHAESINVETKTKISVSESKELFASAPGLKLVDDLSNQQYPMPIDTSGEDLVWIGRIREDLSIPAGLNLWVVGDQIRKGAALNAVQIAEYLIG